MCKKMAMTSEEIEFLGVEGSIKRKRYRAKQIARDLCYNFQFPNYARDIDLCETVDDISKVMANMRRKVTI